ncbi:hypothetical protein PUN28_020762 [Cardiocondyla obscurior]|uniref:Uncharacterized protein n=1 Tax=Cardiocondyla obscurior TaxID=286306 RepID=A0AAW2EAX8_9HYME
MILRCVRYMLVVAVTKKKTEKEQILPFLTSAFVLATTCLSYCLRRFVSSVALNLLLSNHVPGIYTCFVCLCLINSNANWRMLTTVAASKLYYNRCVYN